MCYQGYPLWIVEEEAEAYGISDEEMEEVLYSAAGQTEACLLLDVYVPSSVLASNSSSKGMPIHPKPEPCTMYLK